jgi:hypothetical protein
MPSSESADEKAIATAAWGFERHLVVGLHHHLARFAHRLPVHEKATCRAGGAAAQAFWPQLHAARDRVEQPRTAGAHAPSNRLAVAAARRPRTTRTRFSAFPYRAREILRKAEHITIKRFHFTIQLSIGRSRRDLAKTVAW